jgi:addiction module HigA family antidote
MPDFTDIARWTARPVTPGEYLRRLLVYLDVTQEELAASLDTSRFTVNQIVAGKRTVTPGMALRLSAATGTSIDIWLNLQRDVDLFDAYLEQRDTLARIAPIRDPSPVTIHHVGSDIEMLAHRIVGETFQPLERAAAEIRRAHSGSTSRLQVAVFAPDGLEHACDAYGMECADSMLRHFCTQSGKLSARLGLPVYHFGFEAAAVVLADEAEAADRLLEDAFADIPTDIGYGKFEIRTTISGGIATAEADNDVLSAAVEAAELQQNLAHYRSGAKKHLWSRTFRGR